MADFLIYWKDHWKDKQNGNSNFDEMWHTKQKYFYKKVKKDDSLWFVVFGGKLHCTEWRLISRISVDKRDDDFRNEKPYGIFGNEERSQKFDTSPQSDLTPTLHRLEFASNKRLKVSGRAIGKAIQKIRLLSETDGFTLKDYSKKLNQI